MHIRSLQYLYAILAVAVLSLVSVGTFTFLSLRDLTEESSLVAHTNDVLFQSERVVSLLKDAETGQRGFMITRDSAFFKPRRDALIELMPQLKVVDSLSKIEALPVQRERMKRLSDFVVKRTAGLSQCLDAFSDPPSPDRDLRLLTLLRRGNSNMDSVRMLIDSIQDTEKTLLAERIHQQDRLSTSTLAWLAIISLFSIALLCAAFYFVVREFIRRQKSEQQLERAVADLKRSNQDLAQFNYAASHHLQEPLRKLLTFNNRLAQKHSAELSEDARFLTDRMNNAAQRMRTLLDDVMVYTGLVGPHADTARFEALELSEVIQKAIENQAEKIGATKASLDWDKQQWRIKGHAVHLTMLFAHLLQNSLKFVAEGQKPEISIRTLAVQGSEIPFAMSTQATKPFVKIVFSDNGIGIDTAHRDKIFELFQRLHHSNEYPGTGIGLAICKRIIFQHNGYIELADTTESGTAFHIYLQLS